MKKLNLWTILILFFLITSNCGQKKDSKSESSGEYQFKLTQKWKTKQELKVPESVLYNSEKNILYVSNINGNPLEKNGMGFISIINIDGTIENLEWVTGLNAPKGMGMWQQKLYVTDIDELVEIDIPNGKILASYPATGAIFLNDIAIDNSGNIYISDMSSENSMIYKFHDGQFTVWVQDEQISQPNGLWMGKEKLFVGTSGFLKSVNFNDKMISTIATTGFGIDGLKSDGQGNFLASDWSGKTVFVNSTGKINELLNTTDLKINAADFEYIPEKKLLFIPTFFDNRVVSYLFE